MNIFTEYEDYFGKSEAAGFSQAMKELTDLAVAVRRKLGNQGYLFDEYFCFLLEVAGAVPLYTAAERGFNGGIELRELCRSVMEGKETHTEHPVYEKAKAYISAHPLPHQEVYTRRSLYFVALIDEFVDYVAGKYAHTLKEAIRGVADIAGGDSLYREICAALGSEEDMERFNLLFRQRFLSVTMMAGFIQGLTDSMISEFTSHDAESSKPVARLWLDERLKGD